MVRIWNLPIELLDRQHLLGEHVELHITYNAILRNGGAWFNHPQVKRFHNHLGQLVDRHNQQVAEFLIRGYKHNSPLPEGCESEPYVVELGSESYNEDFKILEEREGLIYQKEGWKARRIEK